jgi:hypothetical protein
MSRKGPNMSKTAKPVKRQRGRPRQQAKELPLVESTARVVATNGHLPSIDDGRLEASGDDWVVRMQWPDMMRESMIQMRLAAARQGDVSLEEWHYEVLLIAPYEIEGFENSEGAPLTPSRQTMHSLYSQHDDVLAACWAVVADYDEKKREMRQS